MCDVSDPALSAAYQDVRDDKSDTDWCVFGYASKTKIELVGSGGGGIDAMRGALDEGQCQYGYVRITTGDDMSVRAKFVFVAWAGQNASVMARAKMSVHKSSIKSVLADYSVEYFADDSTDITVDKIVPLVVKAGGADYSGGGRNKTVGGGSASSAASSTPAAAPAAEPAAAPAAAAPAAAEPEPEPVAEPEPEPVAAAAEPVAAASEPAAEPVAAAAEPAAEAAAETEDEPVPIELADIDDETLNKIRNTFKWFDADGSGEIDASEFQKLAFSLGVTLTKDQVAEYIANIDIDGNGTVSLEEFARWWTQADTADASSGMSARAMQQLKWKLRRKTAAASTNNIVKKAKAKKEIFGEASDSTEIAFTIDVGDTSTEPEESKAAGAFALVVDKAEADAVRARAGAPDAPLVIIQNWTTKTTATDEDVDSFCTKATEFATTMEESYGKYANPPVVRRTEVDGERCIEAVVTFTEHDKVLMGVETFNAMGVASVSAEFEVTQRPGVEPTSDPKAHWALEATIPANAFDIASSVAEDLDEEDTAALHFFSLLQKMRVKMRWKDFATVAEKALAAMEGGDDSDFDDDSSDMGGSDFGGGGNPLAGFLKSKDLWGTVKAQADPEELAFMFMDKDDDELTADAWSLYQLAHKVFEAPKLTHVANATSVITQSSVNFSTFALMPSPEEIEAKIADLFGDFGGGGGDDFDFSDDDVGSMSS